MQRLLEREKSPQRIELQEKRSPNGEATSSSFARRFRHLTILTGVAWSYSCLCYALVCGCFFALPRLRAGENAVEQRLNEVYTRLRHTLTSTEKEALNRKSSNG